MPRFEKKRDLSRCNFFVVISTCRMKKRKQVDDIAGVTWSPTML